MFPAYAGMDRPPGMRIASPACVPRLRGDGPGQTFPTLAKAKCSPPTRGWTVLMGFYRCKNCVFPAYAGMDRLIGQLMTFEQCVPRLRGDGPAHP